MGSGRIAVKAYQTSRSSSWRLAGDRFVGNDPIRARHYAPVIDPVAIDCQQLIPRNVAGAFYDIS
jgi:hypothetical protein